MENEISVITHYLSYILHYVKHKSLNIYKL